MAVLRYSPRGLAPCCRGVGVSMALLGALCTQAQQDVEVGGAKVEAEAYE
jgi:hypothetical protein